MKSLLAVAVICFAGSLAFAETTASKKLTTGTVSKSSATTTGLVSNRQQQMLENMKKRFDDEAELYREVGVSEEKINKLKELYNGIFQAYQRGEQPDYATVRKERAKILSADDVAKFRDLMLARNEDRYKAINTTATVTQTSGSLKTQTTGTAVQ